MVVSLHHHTLGQQLLLSATTTNLLQGVLRIIDETLAEGTQTNLNQSSVVKDLSQDVEVGNGVLQMRHEHHVTGLVVLAMEGEEIDLAQHGSSTNNAVTIAEQVVAEDINQVVGVAGLAARSDDGVDLIARGLPAVLLKGLDNLSRLRKVLLVSASLRNELITGMASYLEVDVFQSPHDDSVDAVLRNLQCRVLAQVLVV